MRQKIQRQKGMQEIIFWDRNYLYFLKFDRVPTGMLLFELFISIFITFFFCQLLKAREIDKLITL